MIVQRYTIIIELFFSIFIWKLFPFFRNCPPFGCVIVDEVQYKIFRLLKAYQSKHINPNISIETYMYQSEHINPNISIPNISIPNMSIQTCSNLTDVNCRALHYVITPVSFQNGNIEEIVQVYTIILFFLLSWRMCFTAKSVKCVLQHLSANHERTLWRIQTFAYARIKIVKEKCHFSLYDCDSGVLAVITRLAVWRISRLSFCFSGLSKLWIGCSHSVTIWMF